MATRNGEVLLEVLGEVLDEVLMESALIEKQYLSLYRDRYLSRYLCQRLFGDRLSILFQYLNKRFFADFSQPVKFFFFVLAVEYQTTNLIVLVLN